MQTLETARYAGSLASNLSAKATAMELYWLGQAGFLLRSSGLTFLIDPYLSDRLAEKYRDHIFPHQRLMAPPITIAELDELDFVFCTHHHGDHLDPPTISAIARKFADVCFIIPAASELELTGTDIKKHQIVWAVAGQEIRLANRLVVIPIKAAHEEFAYDQFGRDRFLGYAVQVEDHLIYHSGDTVLYPGLAEKLSELKPRLALLPVNGRRPELRERNIAGNLSLQEAVQLCLDTGVPAAIAHHFGMFAFNTIDPELIDQAAKATDDRLQLVKAETGVRYFLRSPLCA